MDFNDNSILTEINSIIFKENSPVTIHDVSTRFNIHVSMATRILEKFSSQHDGLYINYLIRWSDTSDSITLRRFLIVSGEEELNFYKSSRDKIDYHVYGLSKDKRPLDLVFSKFQPEPDPDFLTRIQSLSYISNDQIGFRPIKRTRLSNVKSSEKPIQDSQTEKKPSVKVSESPTKKRSNDDEEKPNVKRVKRMENDENEFDGLLEDGDDYLLSKVNADDKPATGSGPPVNETNEKGLSQNVLKVQVKKQTSILSFFKKKP